MKKAELAEVFRSSEDDLCRDEGILGYPRATLETLQAAGDASTFASLCDQEMVLQGVARRCLLGVEPPSTLTWLADLLEPSAETLDDTLQGVCSLSVWEELPTPFPRRNSLLALPGAND